MRFLQLEITQPPTGDVVTPAEFIDHARLNGITVGVQPELIARELRAATARCENWCRRSFLTQTIRARYDSRGGDDALIFLPRGKVQTVESVAVAGAALPADGWTFDDWNAITLATPPTETAVVIWKSGYGDDATTVPDGIKEAILQYGSTLYDDRRGQREVKATADIGDGIPPGVRDILRQFQIEISG